MIGRLFASAPNRLVLPALMLGLAFIVNTGLFLSRIADDRTQSLDETGRALTDTVRLHARQVEAMAELDAGFAAYRSLAELGMDARVEEAWLVAADGEVLASLRRTDLGRSLAQAIARLEAPVADAVAGRSGQRVADREVVAPFHVVVGEPLASGRPELKGTRIVAIGDIQPILSERRTVAVQMFMAEAFGTALLVGLFALVLHFGLSKRLVALQAYAGGLLAGARPPPGLQGRDEISDVARTLALRGREIEARNRLLGALGEVSRLALRIDDAGEFLAAACRAMVDAGGLAAAAISLRAEDSGRIVPAARAGIPDGIDFPPVVDLDDPQQAERPLVRAVRDGQTVKIRLAEYARLPGAAVEAARAMGLTQAIVVPLTHRNERFGALIVFQRDLEAADAAAIDAMRAVAAEIGFSLALLQREQDSRAGARRLATAMSAARLGAWESDEARGVVHASAEWCALVGLPASPTAMPLGEWIQRVHPDDRAAFTRARAGMAVVGHDDCRLEIRLRHEALGWRWFEVCGSVLERDADGHPRRLTGVAADIQNRHEAEAERVLAASVFDNSREGIMVCDAGGTILSVNPSFERITGYPAAEVVGHNASVLHSGLQGEDFYDRLWAALVSAGHWEGEIWNRRRDGEVYPEWLAIARVPPGASGRTLFVGQFTDLSERKDVQRRLEQLSRIDPLTGLRNRPTLVADAEGRGEDGPRAVVCVNVDGFRQINQGLGMAVGDAVLREVAGRLEATLGEIALVARLEGDQFAAVLPGADLAQAKRAVAGVFETFRAPLAASDEPLRLGLSIGIALGPDHARDIEGLLVAAQAAVLDAHDAGRNTAAVFTPGRTGGARERLALESQLRLALEAGEFHLAYQPQVSLANGQLIGIEALVRWAHPTRGELPPGMFIDVAEQTGLIVPLGDFVLREACTATMRLRAMGLPAVPVSVNVSALQFRREDFVDTLDAALRDSGLPPHHLELELTESLLMRGTEEVIARMAAIRARGVRLAIDDFGTGFSSLAYLTRMGLDRLKIDRSFVVDLRRSPRALGVVRAVISLARGLSLNVLAEGVEDAADADVLRALGCDDAQGYLFARPLTEARLLAGWGEAIEVAADPPEPLR